MSITLAASHACCPPSICTALSTANYPPSRRHLPVSKASWQDVKGAMVLAGAYEEAVKMMGDMNFLQVG